MFYRQVVSRAAPAAPREAPRGPQARRAREIEALRHRILDVAEEILVSEGYAALSMRRIADTIEYAASSLYGYFESKEQILTAVLERTTGRLLEALAEANRTPGPLTRLRMLGRAYVEFALTYPRHYEVLFLLRGPTVPVIETPAFTAAIESFRTAVVEGIERNMIRRANPDEIAQAFWAACHGLVALLLTHGERYPFADSRLLLEALLTMQIEGLRPQAFGITAPVRPPRTHEEPTETNGGPGNGEGTPVTVADSGPVEPES